MSKTLMELAEHLVPISDFSQGKAGKIFKDVSENNNQYIVLKNNQPTAVLLSMQEYKNMQHKITQMERMQQYAESIQNLEKACRHQTLEERATPFGNKIGPYEEYGWGEPAGRERW